MTLPNCHLIFDVFSSHLHFSIIVFVGVDFVPFYFSFRLYFLVSESFDTLLSFDRLYTFESWSESLPPSSFYKLIFLPIFFMGWDYFVLSGVWGFHISCTSIYLCVLWFDIVLVYRIPVIIYFWEFSRDLFCQRKVYVLLFLSLFNGLCYIRCSDILL